MRKSIENLRQVVRFCRDEVPPDRDLLDWLGSCLEDALARRAASFEEAFGLQNDRGGVPWWLEQAMRDRNQALQALARHHFAELSPSRQARKIAVLSSRYADSTWRFDRSRSVLPAHYRGRPQEWLWRAFRTGAPMPLGERQLRNVLAPEARPRGQADAGEAGRRATCPAAAR